MDKAQTSKFIIQPCRYQRRQSSIAQIGKKPLGGENPIRLQSMASTSTMDTEESIEQCKRIIEAGADYVRFTAQGVREAKNLANIHQALSDYNVPLVADIHFNPKAADEALLHVEKVRVNPGNYVDTNSSTPREWTEEMYEEAHNKVVERFGAFVQEAKRLGRAIRIGVNHGSLSERMLMLHGDTPYGMVASCLEYLDVCQQNNFHDVVISMKSSNTIVMTSAVRLLVEELAKGGYPAYPLHLGVTEAGEGEDGRIKSAVGIGSLLMDGIGDTIRVSLSEEPEFEVPVARALVDYVQSRGELEAEFKDILPSWEEYKALTKDERKTIRLPKAMPFAGNMPLVLSEEDTILADLQEKNGKLLLAQFDEEIDAKTIKLDYRSINDELAKSLLEEPQTVVLLDAPNNNPVAEWRLGFTMLRRLGLKNSIILCHRYDTDDIDLFRLQASADAGTIFLDGWANGLFLTAPKLEAKKVLATQYGILQATRLRMSKTEFISCPGCGRTLYNLQDTIAQVKSATEHLKGLKIGIMGCIVNGPGEMADADYGYVGSSPEKIDLYKGQKCVRRGVKQAEAVKELIELIKTEGDWEEPKTK